MRITSSLRALAFAGALLLPLPAHAGGWEQEAPLNDAVHVLGGVFITSLCLAKTDLPEWACVLAPVGVAAVKELVLDDNPSPRDAIGWAAGGVVSVTIFRWRF